MTKSKYKLIGPFKQLLPMTELPIKGPLKEHQLKVFEKGAVILEGNKLYAVGKYRYLLDKANGLNAEILELKKDYVCLPGFIDAHTHICFGGSTSEDYTRINSGINYLELTQTRECIWDTVLKTRNATQLELQEGIIKRVNKHLTDGVTTIEVKSGFGLNLEDELKILRAINVVNNTHKADLISTCLAAHILPQDYKGNHQDYLNKILEKLLPQIRQEGLSKRVDILIGKSAFSADMAKNYLYQAKKLGFRIVVHADKLSTGGSRVAKDLKAISADHLEASTENEIELLAHSDVIPVVLPGASLELGSFAPARKLLDAGASLAIGSDWNPESSTQGNLLKQATILGAKEGLSNAEILAGITYRAAAALGLPDRGKMDMNSNADFIVFQCDHYNEIIYNQGKLKPDMVWKNGELIG